MITSKKRMARILRHKTADRIGLFAVFWNETAEKWSCASAIPSPRRLRA
jgi:hypothetical protein